MSEGGGNVDSSVMECADWVEEGGWDDGKAVGSCVVRGARHWQKRGELKALMLTREAAEANRASRTGSEDQFWDMAMTLS